jgi:hypothetical protein
MVLILKAVYTKKVVKQKSTRFWSSKDALFDAFAKL